MYDECYKVTFDKSRCVIENACDGKILFIGNRCGNVYTIDIECASTNDKYFSTLHDDGWLRHIRLGYASMYLISKISKNDLVKGLPKISFQKIKFVKHANLVNKSKHLLKAKIIFLLQNRFNYFI